MPAKINGKERDRNGSGKDTRPDRPVGRGSAKSAPDTEAKRSPARQPTMADEPADVSPTGAAATEADAATSPAVLDAPFAARSVSPDALDRLSAAADDPGVGGAFAPDPELAGAVGFTHFDAPTAEDDALTVLLPREAMARLPAGSLVRIRSPRDEPDADAGSIATAAASASTAVASAAREYLGVVVAGPFAEPDGLKVDSSLVVATTVSGNGRVLLPRYHGRAMVQLIGEIDRDSGEPPSAPRVFPPRHRPSPNSPVFPLSDADAAAFLKVGGGRPADARLGLLVGRDRVAVHLPTDRKHVLPRHTGILGTTGGGKSTTVATLLHGLAAAGVATVVVDVEGEYTEVDRPTADPDMLRALARRGLAPGGVGDLHVLHPVGRETSRPPTPDDPNAGPIHPFSLLFSELSPYAVTEMLEMPEPQQERFLKAFDVARAALKSFGVFPAGPADDERFAALDELETGYPKMTLDHLIDVCDLFARAVGKDESEPRLRSPVFAANLSKLKGMVGAAKSSHEFSWRGLLGRLHRVNRLRIFDNPAAAPLRYDGFLVPGRTSVIDLADTDEPQVRNLVIADVLRGIQRAQDRAAAAALAAGRSPTPVVVVLEEAHEFLSAQRIKQMPTLFQQVARIARRGRKRWLGLTFVTQLPQHLPDEVLGLVNNWVIHKIADVGVVDRLRKSISGLDRGQWHQVAGLAPGQAVVSLTSLTRPLVVSVDPAPCRLRLVD